MSATEELRRLLDEHGVVYKKPEDDTTIYYDSDGNRYTYNVNPDSGWSQLFGYNLTPEQAIAATLGRLECEFKPFKGPISDTDEEGERQGVCSVCSAYMHEQFCFCPNCGRRVKP